MSLPTLKTFSGIKNCTLCRNRTYIYCLDVVVLLTRSKNEKYESYIERIKTNPIAIEVKLSDLKHNMDWTRNKIGITPKDIERTIKYHGYYVELYKCLKTDQSN